MQEIIIDGETLTIEDVVKVAREGVRVAVSQGAKGRVRESRAVLEKLLSKNYVIYGVNTGFGELSNIRIDDEEISQLQSNLIRSHSSGVGEAASTDVVRALMLLRANTLAKGYSGIRLETLETLVAMLNKGIHPIIPTKGSVGASGDLAPLSHMILVMIGEGEAEYQGKIMSGKEAMERARIKPVQLEFKEGVALNNGTQVMTAVAALAVYDAERLVEASEAAASLTVEAMQGVTDAFDPKIHKIRPYEGQSATADHIRQLIRNSKLMQTGKEAMEKRQRPHDPYSLRCAPQVLGAVRDAVGYARKVVQVEINSATDNPLVFVEEEACLSGGNFHGQPIALAMDLLGMALTIVGNFSERKTAKLIDGRLSNGLPMFLVPPDAKDGVNNGLMTAQYTAAALASENKVLAHPACVDSIPTSANFEDFVSMGTAAAFKAVKILENVQYVVAIELLCAAQAVEYRGPEKLGTGTGRVYAEIRKVVPKLVEDRVLSDDIRRIRMLIREDRLASKS